MVIFGVLSRPVQFSYISFIFQTKLNFKEYSTMRHFVNLNMHIKRGQYMLILTGQNSKLFSTAAIIIMKKNILQNCKTTAINQLILREEERLDAFNLWQYGDFFYKLICLNNMSSTLQKYKRFLHDEVTLNEMLQNYVAINTEA